MSKHRGSITDAARDRAVAGLVLRLLTPAEVASTLGCSEWWVKEQARKRRIPFTRAGGAYRFTPEHVHEIIRIFEQRPAEGQPALTGGRRHRPVAQPAVPAVELRARRPRRAAA